MDIRMMIRNTIGYIKRILCSAGFWLSVGLGCIILLTSVTHKDMQGVSYNVLTSAMQLSKEELLNYGITVQMTFSNAIHYAMPMYGTLLAALSYAGVLCEEKKIGVKRYLLFRFGKKEYVLTRSFAVLFASGFSFVVAGLFLLVFLYWKFPLMSSQDIEAFQMWLEFQAGSGNGMTVLLYEWFGEHAYNLQLLSGLFVYGLFCGFIGYLCAAFFSNVYLMVCIPFFFGYMYFSIARTIQSRVIEGSISNEVSNIVNDYVSPTGYLMYWRQTESFVCNMIVLVLVWVIAIVLHMVRIQKSSDCGGR